MVKGTLDASLYIVNQTLSKLKGIELVNIGLLKKVILLFLKSAKNVHLYKTDNDLKTDLNRCMEKSFQNLHNSLKKWLNTQIGVSFGEECSTYLFFSKKNVTDEIEVCTICSCFLYCRCLK